MNPASKPALARYAAGGRKQLSGWLARIDAEIFKAILLGQNEGSLSGSAVEIGVHHGKSFIAMFLGLEDNERAYCVDVFEDQHLNKDKSGQGDRVAFENNLQRFGIDTKKVTIDARSSQDVKPDDILGAVGPARIFSIDGGHWLEIVKNDLHLAEVCLAEHGVIALDDFHRPEWPDVSAGYFAWYSGRSKPIVPFAIGFNKLYLCHEKWFDFYQNLLKSDTFIMSFLTRNLEFQGVKVPVFYELIEHEFGLRRRLSTYIRLFNPDIYHGIVTLKKSISGYRNSP